MPKFLAAILMICIGGFCTAQTPKPTVDTIKDKYHAIEVNDFEIQQGVDLPPDYFASLQDELVKQLADSRQFEVVLRHGEKPPKADMPVLRLTGVVTKFDEGSRAKRYLVGYGAGSSQIYAHAKYLDGETGQTVIEQEVIGTLSGGLFGGDTKNVIHQFATTVVTTTKLMLLKKPMPEGAAVSAAPVAETAEPAERTTVEITSGEFDAKQKSLDELAAKGFRIVDYNSTSNKSATILLEKSAHPAPERAYLMMQTNLPGTLQKELNKAALEGYRLVPHTLGYLRGYFLIAEKGVAAPGTRFEYRFHATVRVSSAEKDIMKDQSEGFVLIDTSQVPNSLHLIVLEKEVKEATPVVKE